MLVLLRLLVLCFIWGSAATARADDCPARAVTIRGESLSPLLHDGASVMMRPAVCAGGVGRGDLVIFHTGALKEPVIKKAMGLPGDRFALDDAGQVLINDAALKNSVGVVYILQKSARIMLQSYIQDYSGVIPADTYLLLGDGGQGLLDSTRLGLVHRSDFIMVGHAPR